MKTSAFSQAVHAHASAFITAVREAARNEAMKASQALADAFGEASVPPTNGHVATPEQVTAERQEQIKGLHATIKARTARTLQITPLGVLAVLERADGLRLEEIAKSVGVKTKTLKRPIATLLADRRIRKTGQRRGTRYFAREVKGAKAKR